MGCPSRKYIGCQEEGSWRVKEVSYVTIRDGALVLEGSLSEVGTSPPDDLNIPHGMVASNTHTHYKLIIAIYLLFLQL